MLPALKSYIGIYIKLCFSIPRALNSQDRREREFRKPRLIGPLTSLSLSFFKDTKDVRDVYTRIRIGIIGVKKKKKKNTRRKESTVCLRMNLKFRTNYQQQIYIDSSSLGAERRFLPSPEDAISMHGYIYIYIYIDYKSVNCLETNLAMMCKLFVFLPLILYPRFDR